MRKEGGRASWWSRRGTDTGGERERKQADLRANLKKTLHAAHNIVYGDLPTIISVAELLHTFHHSLRGSDLETDVCSQDAGSAARPVPLPQPPVIKIFWGHAAWNHTQLLAVCLID